MSKIKSTKQFKEQVDAAFATMQTRDEAKACYEFQREEYKTAEAELCAYAAANPDVFEGRDRERVKREGRAPARPQWRAVRGAIRSWPPPVHGRPQGLPFSGGRAKTDRTPRTPRTWRAVLRARGVGPRPSWAYTQGRLGRTPKAVMGVHPRGDRAYTQHDHGCTSKRRSGLHPTRPWVYMYGKA